MSEIDRTANFFFILFWNWSPFKAKIKSVWFRCFILENAECIFFSQDWDLSAVDLRDSSTTPLQWPFLLSLTQTKLTHFLPWNLLMSCASFLNDWHNSHLATAQELDSTLNSPLPHHLVTLLILDFFLGPTWTSLTLLVSLLLPGF